MGDEIERIRRADERRGRRPVDQESVDERRRLVAAFRKILDTGTVDSLKAAMREYGISADSQEWDEALRIWREEREQG